MEEELSMETPEETNHMPLLSKFIYNAENLGFNVEAH